MKKEEYSLSFGNDFQYEYYGTFMRLSVLEPLWQEKNATKALSHKETLRTYFE